MRLRELFENSIISEGLLKDGPVQASDHFRKRVVGRDFDPAYVKDFMIKTILRNKKDIEELPVDTSFVLRDKGGMGIGFLKQDRPDGLIYLITTIHPQMRAGPGQIIFRESDELDKPTPSVGTIAEKNHCSLIAVEKQLEKGIEHEMEHTNQYRVAREIALDHLGEDLYYYDKLDKVEKTNEGQFRAQDVEEFKPNKENLSNLKSKYLPDWEMLDHRILQADFNAKDHRHAEQFMERINKISEQMDHFCEVTQDVAEVTVKTTTSDVKGLTLLDFQIAMRIDKLAEKMDIEQIRSKGNFNENFADGKGPGRPGDSARHGIPKGATIAQLEKASKAKGRKGQLARWQLNMRRGKKKG